MLRILRWLRQYWSYFIYYFFNTTWINIYEWIYLQLLERTYVHWCKFQSENLKELAKGNYKE